MKVNYKKLFDTLEELGANPKDKGNHWECQTVCHGGDSHKLYFYLDNNTFFCYTSCGKISLYDFLKEQNISYNEIVETNNSLNIKEGFTNIEIELPTYEEFKKPIVIPAKETSILNNYKDIYYEGWKREHIDYNVMKKNNIKYDLSKNHIIIPHYNINNELIGVRYRDLNKWAKAKYHPVLNYEFNTGDNLYGINKIINNKPIVLVEAEKSVLQLESYGINNGLALLGSNLTDNHVNLINSINVNQEIVIALDKEYEYVGDQKYQLQIKKIKNKFLPKLKCGSRIVTVIIDRYNLLNEKDSPTDRGKDTFKRLFENRIVL